MCTLIALRDITNKISTENIFNELGKWFSLKKKII